MDKTLDFIKACHQGRLDEAHKLLGKAAINGVNEVGQGALLTFHPEVCRFLLENGADPNLQRNENGSSVLAGIAYVHNFECLDLLLSHGADPNLGRSESGETPLHYAMCGTGQLDLQAKIVTALLVGGADPNRRAATGVISYNFMRDVRVRGETALHRAAAYASTETIQALLAAGADTSLRDSNGDSALSWGSLYRRDSEVLKLLCFGEFAVR